MTTDTVAPEPGLTARLPLAPAELDRLRTRLGVDAERAGLLDVAFDLIATPVGELLVAATARGVVRLAFDSEDRDEVLAHLAGRIGPRVLRAPARLVEARAQLAAYFAGELTEFTLDLDHVLSRGFRARVQTYLPRIGYGRTATYTQVAAAVGSPGAVRAVGSACATNPIPIIQPCHRVLRSDGSLGGYRGGLAAKDTLLRLEGAA